MDIGNKIRELRTRKGLTLEELASRSELTKGFLSQLERDLTSPSIDSLSDILEALGTNLAEFFQEDKNDQFIFHADDFFVDEREDCTVNWIVPNTQKNPLRRGETFYLHGRSFHLLKNVRKTTARVLWVSTPPLF